MSNIAPILEHRADPCLLFQQYHLSGLSEFARLHDAKVNASGNLITMILQAIPSDSVISSYLLIIYQYPKLLAQAKVSIRSQIGVTANIGKTLTEPLKPNVVADPERVKAQIFLSIGPLD